LKISAILLSRVLAFIDVADLRPTNGLYAPEFVEEVANQFGFQKVPKTLEEFDVTKGMEFHNGRLGKAIIGKFVIWPNILIIEGRSSTTECKEMLGEILQWATDKFKLTYSPEMIKRYAYVSDVSFYSDSALLSVSPAMSYIADSCSAALSEIWQEPVEYRPISLKVGHDPVLRQAGIAPFTIERLGTARFSENKYFSEAPLPTDMHVQILEQFEKESSSWMKGD
jgi:hypothetical protein